MLISDDRYETDVQIHRLSRADLLRLAEQIGKDRTLPNTAQANRGRARANGRKARSNGSRSAKREALAKILGISASGKSLRELEAMIAKAPKGGAIYECNNAGCRFVGDKAAMARHAKTHRESLKKDSAKARWVDMSKYAGSKYVVATGRGAFHREEDGIVSVGLDAERGKGTCDSCTKRAVWMFYRKKQFAKAVHACEAHQWALWQKIKR